MVGLREVILVAPVAAVLVAGILTAWPWARTSYRSVVAGVGIVPAVAAWNLVLYNANAANLDVDGPIARLSFQDVGSGVLAFVGVVLALGLTVARSEPAHRVVTAGLIAALVTTSLDIFI